MKLALSLTALFLEVGCSGTSQDVIDTRKSAAQTYREAELAFQQKNFRTAEYKYAAAVDSGGLYLDVRVEGMIHMAVCQGALGNLAAAQKLLDELERNGAAGSDSYFAARSFLYDKQGKNREAKAAWRKAKRVNRKVARFSG